MPKPIGLGHVGIHVSDITRSRAFYRDILGLTITDEDLDFAGPGGNQLEAQELNRPLRPGALW